MSKETEGTEYDKQYYFCYKSMAVVSNGTGTKYTKLVDIFGDHSIFRKDACITEKNYELVLIKWLRDQSSKPLEVRNKPNYDIKAINKALEMYNGDTPTLS